MLIQFESMRRVREPCKVALFFFASPNDEWRQAYCARKKSRQCRAGAIRKRRTVQLIKSVSRSQLTRTINDDGLMVPVH